MKKCVGASIARAVEVLAAVQPLDDLHEPDRLDVVDAAGARVVAFLRRVAGDREDVANAFGVRTEEERLQPRDRRVARGLVRDRLEPDRPLDRDRAHDPAHSRASARVVVDVDELGGARVLERLRDFEHPGVRAAERRVELHRDDPLALAEHPGERGLGRSLLDLDRRLALPEDEWSARLAGLVDRTADRGDLRGRGAAAAADDLRAEPARVRRELGEVLRRGVRVDHAAAGHAREADVRQSGERDAVAAHVLDRPERRLKAGAVVRAEGADPQLTELVGRLASTHAGEGLGFVLEREQRDDRQARDAANGLDRDDKLVEVEERLEHEQVGAAPLQDRRLLGEEPGSLFELRVVTQRADRAPDEDVAPGDLARLSREADAGGDDLLELVLEVVAGQLPTVRAEGVRLDQLGARADEADVQRDDGVRRSKVRLLGGAESRDGARDERAHAAVADDRRTVLEALDESVRCSHWDLPSLDILPGLTDPAGLGTLLWGQVAEASQGRFPQPLSMRSGSGAPGSGGRV